MEVRAPVPEGYPDGRVSASRCDDGVHHGMEDIKCGSGPAPEHSESLQSDHKITLSQSLPERKTWRFHPSAVARSYLRQMQREQHSQTSPSPARIDAEPLLRYNRFRNFNGTPLSVRSA